MFNRPGKAGGGARSSDGASPSDGRRSPKVASLITDDITIAGDISGDGELQADCVIRGDVSVTHLSIGEGGRIEGAVTAETVEVRGQVKGSITARQIRLYATAQVDGDLTHDQLTIEPGARFEGRSQRFASATPALAAIGVGDPA